MTPTLEFEMQLLDEVSSACETDIDNLACGRVIQKIYSHVCDKKSAAIVSDLVDSGGTGVRVGVAIAAMVGEFGFEVFGKISSLIDSEDSFVRGEVIECYLNCAKTGKDILKLAEKLDDPDKFNRIRAFDYMHFLSNSQIEAATHEAAKSNALFLLNGFKLMSKAVEGQLSIIDVERAIKYGSPIEKKLSFSSAMIGKISDDKLYGLALDSKDKDVFYYCSVFLEIKPPPRKQRGQVLT